MLPITPTIVLRDAEIQEDFTRSSGPGGQNVNKVSTAVQLRFNVFDSPSLPSEVKERLAHTAGKRITEDGTLIIKAQRFRTQERNRQDARDQLVEMIRSACVRPLTRRPTRPSLASKQRRLATKRKAGETKRLRSRLTPDSA